MDFIDKLLTGELGDLTEEISHGQATSILEDSVQIAPPLIAANPGYSVRVYLLQSSEDSSYFSVLVEKKNGEHTYHLAKPEDPIDAVCSLDRDFLSARYFRRKPDIFAYSPPLERGREAA